MKRIIPFIIFSFLLSSCSQSSYSFKDITGFDVTNISKMTVSSSYYQSVAWSVDKKYYSIFDCNYLLVNLNLDKEIFDDYSFTYNKEYDAVCIHLEADLSINKENLSTLFYIRYKDRFIYTETNEKEKSHRSINKVSDEIINQMTSIKIMNKYKF